MPDRDQLRMAADHLAAAAEALEGTEAAARVADVADRYRGFVEADRTPDHGRLARTLHLLDEVETDAGSDASDAIERARRALTTYREGVEGV